MSSRRKRGSGGRRGRDEFPVAWAVLAGLAFALIGGLFVWAYLDAMAKNPERDRVTLCPKAGPREQVLVLLDATDPIGSVTQQDILNYLQKAAQAVPKGGLFELRLLRTGQDRTETLFSGCNPGDNSDVAFWNGNPDAAAKLWQERFAKPLKQAMSKGFAGEGADTSPIMSGLQMVALDRLADVRERGLPSRLIVVSDMLENTPSFSLYKSGPDYSAFAKSEAMSRYATDLGDATVEIWIVKRASSPSTSAVADFWLDWVTDQHGSFGRSIQLQGVSQ